MCVQQFIYSFVHVLKDVANKPSREMRRDKLMEVEAEKKEQN